MTGFTRLGVRHFHRLALYARAWTSARSDVSSPLCLDVVQASGSRGRGTLQRFIRRLNDPVDDNSKPQAQPPLVLVHVSYNSVTCHEIRGTSRFVVHCVAQNTTLAPVNPWTKSRMNRLRQADSRGSLQPLPNTAITHLYSSIEGDVQCI